MSASSHPSVVARDGLAWQLLQALPEATVLIDPESLVILEVNTAAERLTGRSRSNLVELSLTDLFPTLNPGTLSTILPADQEAVTEPQEMIELRLTGDQSVAVSLTGRLLDTDGQSIGMLTVRPGTSLSISVNEESPQKDQAAQDEERFHRLFNESPIALFEMDWSGIHRRLQEITDSGITDFRRWLSENPQEVVRLSQLARITAVNRGALEMFEALSLEDFAGNIGSVMQQDSLRAFKEHLLFRMEGGRTYETENVAYTISGKRIHIHIQAASSADSEHTCQSIGVTLTKLSSSTRNLVY